MELSLLVRLAAVVVWAAVDLAVVMVVAYLYGWSWSGAAMGAVLLGGLSTVWVLAVRARSSLVIASAALVAAAFSWVLTAAVLVAMPDIHNQMPRLEFLATTLAAMFSWEMLSLAPPLLVLLGGAIAGGYAGLWLRRLVPPRARAV
jgi:hypothetical protein